MKRKRRLTRLGVLGDELIQRMDPQGQRHRARVVAAWPDVAGAEVANHTQGFSLRSGELVVFVDSSVWANELALMSEDYRHRLNEEADEDLVRRIRFIVSKRAHRKIAVPDRPKRAEPASGSPSREPLSEAELAQVRYAAASVKDDSLREAVVRAMTRDLERREAHGGRSAGVDPQTPKDSV